jgi:hypothetical protein
VSGQNVDASVEQRLSVSLITDCAGPLQVMDPMAWAVGLVDCEEEQD